jgi:hypothetical protein
MRVGDRLALNATAHAPLRRVDDGLNGLRWNAFGEHGFAGRVLALYWTDVTCRAARRAARQTEYEETSAE